jgi:hypothetical protein
MHSYVTHRAVLNYWTKYRRLLKRIPMTLATVADVSVMSFDVYDR